MWSLQRLVIRSKLKKAARMIIENHLGGSAVSLLRQTRGFPDPPCGGGGAYKWILF